MVSSMIGRTISHYRVLERLGGGGMGEVFLAEDLRLERKVALKFLPSSFAADDDAKQRFLQEARSASALDHPNVCTLFDVDETENGRLFLAMAYYPGQSLKQCLASGGVSVERALDVTAQVAKGLAVAHDAGIVHRDIKPANLMLARDGVVKIVDFGLAKLVDEPGVTRTGHSIGTPAGLNSPVPVGVPAGRMH